MRLLGMGAICVLLVLAPSASAAPIDAEAIAERNMGAVLIIHGKRIDTGAEVQGSGCCIHPDGYILATAHQAEGVDQFMGRFTDGVQVPLTLVESRPDIEYALFKSDAPLKAYVPIGDAATVKSGAPVVSIASPISLEFSTVNGTVSNPNKVFGGYPVMLVSLTATHGSSGGPVFDRQGNLIGLISGGLSDVDFTIVNKINNAYPLLAARGILPPAGTTRSDDEAVLVPVAGLTLAENKAIEAYNRGVAANTIAEKVDAYGLATTLLPGFYEALFNLAVAEAGAGDIEKAAALYLEADKLRPDGVDAKRNLGRLYLRVKQYSDARALFEEVLRLAPGEPQSHNDLGETCRRAGDLESAIRYFTSSLELQNNAPGVHFNLALALANLGRTADAINHFEAYLALAPAAGDRAEVEAWIAKLKTPQ